MIFIGFGIMWRPSLRNVTLTCHMLTVKWWIGGAGTVAALKRQAEEAAAAGKLQGEGTAAQVPQEALTQAGAAWEAFHARDNATARFYKERRWHLTVYSACSPAGAFGNGHHGS